MLPDWKRGGEEKPFAGKEVYFSNSISGVVNLEKNFGWEIVQFLADNGAHVLDRHVGGRSEEERVAIFKEEFGFNYRDAENPKAALEGKDMELVDRASHVIAFVDGPSFGVGTEVQRAIDRFEFNGEDVKILCLINEQNPLRLSWMISGKESPKYPNFHLMTYRDLEDAKVIIFNFLTMH